MNIEKIEHAVVYRALAISPSITSAEVIFIAPIKLPEQAQGDAYTGVLVIGKGKAISGGSIEATDVPSMKGSIHETTFATAFFAIVMNGDIHVYLENPNILNFLKK